MSEYNRQTGLGQQPPPPTAPSSGVGPAGVAIIALMSAAVAGFIGFSLGIGGHMRGDRYRR